MSPDDAATGPAGATGPTGATGATGPTGPSGADASFDGGGAQTRDGGGARARLRAGDADRTAVAQALAVHLAAGRLTLAEFEERSEAAAAARTLGALDALLADLPGGWTPGAHLPALPIDASRPVVDPGLPAERSSSQGLERHRAHLVRAWRSYLTCVLICVVIWALTGASASLWWLWVAGPWGAALVARSLTHAVEHRRRRSPP